MDRDGLQAIAKKCTDYHFECASYSQCITVEI